MVAAHTVNLEKLRGQPLIVGAGIAGVLVALHMNDAPCILIAGREPQVSDAGCDSLFSLLKETGSSTERAARTLRAGKGLARLDVVQCVMGRMDQAMASLARFDFIRTHGWPDSESALYAILFGILAKRKNVTIIPATALRQLILVEGHVRGAVLATGDKTGILDTGSVIMAGSGACGLFGNDPGLSRGTGSCMAIAARSGATLCDMEFVRFDPFALSIETTGKSSFSVPPDLWEGQVSLLDEKGNQLDVAGEDSDGLARFVQRHADTGHAVFLDLSRQISGQSAIAGDHFDRFLKRCTSVGLDPRSEALPVKAAAAFHIGGIRADIAGRTSISGLWACGECASTGLHGASALPANPLLEMIVCSEMVAESVLNESKNTRIDVSMITPDLSVPNGVAEMLRPLVKMGLGPVREGSSLRQALFRVSRLASCDDAALVAQMMMISAYQREESRGAHFRSDFTAESGAARHTELCEKSLAAMVRSIAYDVHDLNTLDTAGSLTALDHRPSDS
ncbi:FAD-binding protein [Acetobacter sp.]|jgi:L-aspartate oxidase|uniref:FAD-binding protein n=1 Tax=Acetobacter sp. TaxID=440 RepID=UPI0025BEABD0|nr:FAD-binding protein [Acetobacter sp.]MCH4090311.1 FAD-binding protein [Acetobacter sp.]MCI1299005.1 FAD-binding protein [Acetobacter sp.]MCI1315025.1 FAD-binding protein [Acetobacter sp.]